MDTEFGESTAEEWSEKMEDCPVCGKDIPFNLYECPACGYQADQFFLAEQVMTSRVRQRTFDVPSGAVGQAAAPIVTEPARKKRGFFSKAKDNGNRNNGSRGNGRRKPQWR
jgi:hypothetical protein